MRAPSLPLSLSDHYSAMLADALELCNVGNARGEGGTRLLFAARFGEGAAPASEASASAHAFDRAALPPPSAPANLPAVPEDLQVIMGREPVVPVAGGGQSNNERPAQQ